MHVGQAIFYLALIATAAAWNREGSPLTFAAAGIAAGALFLTHTAPALLLGIAMAVEVDRRLRQPNRGGWVAGCAVCLAAAVIVASPFLASIVGHYRLHILNPAPLAFVAPSSRWRMRPPSGRERCRRRFTA
jgi:hypothetical protein